VNPPYSKNRVIGLLGGSFNPAHSAHLYLSLYALKSLPIDEIWWLVSPKNPLKKASDLAEYSVRLASAKRMAKGHRRIRVLDIEQRYGSYYTCDTIELLTKRFKGTYFAWLMGADNLAQFHRWRRWQEIAVKIPLVIVDRAPHSHSALRSRAFTRNRKFLIKNIGIENLKSVPGMGVLPMPRQSLSSSHLRKMLGDGAFLGHNVTIAGD